MDLKKYIDTVNGPIDRSLIKVTKNLIFILNKCKLIWGVN